MASPASAFITAVFTPLLCGFCAGISYGNIGGVLENTAFNQRYDHPSDSTLEPLAAMMQAGCVFGSMWASWGADALGRRASILIAMIFLVLASGILLLPALISSNSLVPLFVGRLLTGIGAGISATVIPLHVSESAPAASRGAIEASFQLAIELGILCAYVINWTLRDTHSGWVVSLVAPLPSALMFLILAVKWLPESPRYLVLRGRESQAAAVLASRLRTSRDDVGTEMKAILKADSSLVAVRWSELLASGVRRRVGVAMVVLMLQVGTGIDMITVYAPRIFALLEAPNATTAVGAWDEQGGNSQAAMYTIFVGVVFCVVTPFAIFAVDRCGRRCLLLAGGGLMAFALAGLSAAYSALQAQQAAATKHAAALSDHSNGWLPYLAVSLVLIYVAAFSFSWGPIAWIVPSEMITSRLRAKVVALGTVLNWLADWAVVGSFLTLSQALGEVGTFALYAVINVLAVAFVWLLVPETKGRHLEDVGEDSRPAEDARHSGPEAHGFRAFEEQEVQVARPE